jgi:hypothetical protein
MPRIALFFSFFFLFHSLSAQSQIDGIEKELSQKYEAMNAARSDSARMFLSDAFKAELKRSLYKTEAFEHPFRSLKMCTITSPDKAFRVFNWNIPMNDGTHRYEALIMIPRAAQERELMDVIELKPIEKDLDRLENRSFREGEWMPFLIYEIIPDKKEDQYILLAWDGHDRISNRKVIDVITISSRSVRLGAPVFKDGKSTYKRVLFTYAEEVNMSLRYQEKEKRILFDHLAPKDPRLEGQFQFYGPDMSFDSYISDKGKWNLESDVEFLRKRQEKDKKFNDPRRK